MSASAASGPTVARLFHRLLGLVFLAAWLSLGAQVDLLMGSRGLLPIADFAVSLRASDGATLLDFPTFMWWWNGDRALATGIWIGVALATAATLGIFPRACFALLVPLYLSYATAGRVFLSFQWDNLLLECGALAVFLPRRHPQRWTHVLFRLLLFKLYFQSGIAKWQSHLHDWHDGSAMTFYYETAPLPTALAWFTHALPAWWHHVESRATLALELACPLAFFGPRRARLAAATALTLFQIVNLATANYGFFCWLAVALHVFLLSDRDVARAWAWLRRAPRDHAEPSASVAPGGWASTLAALVVVPLYVSISAMESLVHFGCLTPSDGTCDGESWAEIFAPQRDLYEPLRLVNTYHLFGHITRERIEPEFSTLEGGAWTARDLRFKPGDPARAPPFVAPHQPRVDFQLWFYGLSSGRGTPRWVAMLLERMCENPEAVRNLFAAPLPRAPEAARVGFWRYHFTTPAERRATGAWWTRTWIGAGPARDCVR
ncbi:MAG: lipase maturation factor family protein [Myxococcota bacterium]